MSNLKSDFHFGMDVGTVDMLLRLKCDPHFEKDIDLFAFLLLVKGLAK